MIRCFLPRSGLVSRSSLHWNSRPSVLNQQNTNPSSRLFRQRYATRRRAVDAPARLSREVREQSACADQLRISLFQFGARSCSPRGFPIRQMG